MEEEKKLGLLFGLQLLSSAPPLRLSPAVDASQRSLGAPPEPNACHPTMACLRSRTRLKSLGDKLPSLNFIRYADDFIITSKSKELLEREIKPLVEQFLQKRGLELSPTKTVITHVEKGFDFLGQNVRRYPNGKLLIKPSKKNVKTFLEGVRRTIKAALGSSAAALIEELNPKIRGWANYHRHVVSKRMFTYVDHAIFSRLWRWARRRHRNKNPRWIKEKYFERRR
jgi:RNA-directed DNA polymerase